MTKIREKLAKLLLDAGAGCDRLRAGEISDRLIANGVTVQQWIPVTERLPKESDADGDNCVLAIHKATQKRYFHWRSVADNPFDFTHWMPLPQPPKGE